MPNIKLFTIVLVITFIGIYPNGANTKPTGEADHTKVNADEENEDGTIEEANASKCFPLASPPRVILSSTPYEDKYNCKTTE